MRQRFAVGDARNFAAPERVDLRLMSENLAYLLAGIVLVVANTTAWVATWFGLPGTWIIVALTALVCHFFPGKADGALGLSWTSVIVLAVMALVGELWETGAAAAAAKKVGGSRRGATFAMLGAFLGSIVGAFLGTPIPIIGTLVGAVAGAAGGAFAGAWIGEGQVGKSLIERVAIGKAAASGRVLGTLGKLFIGLAMVLVSTAAYFL